MAELIVERRRSSVALEHNSNLHVIRIMLCKLQEGLSLRYFASAVLNDVGGTAASSKYLKISYIVKNRA